MSTQTKVSLDDLTAQERTYYAALAEAGYPVEPVRGCACGEGDCPVPPDRVVLPREYYVPGEIKWRALVVSGRATRCWECWENYSPDDAWAPVPSCGHPIVLSAAPASVPGVPQEED